VSLEADYQTFVAMAWKGQQIGQTQIDAMRDAFFAGALIGAQSQPAEIFAEVRQHALSIDPKRN
jgi:hypothetical protein